MATVTFAPSLYLNDTDDHIYITSSLFMASFDVELTLREDHIAVEENRKVIHIPIHTDSVVLITVDQGGNKGPNTFAEIYIQSKNELVLMKRFGYTEVITNERETRLYAMVEYLAKRVSDKYHITWEYKYGIDSAEYQKRTSKALLWGVIVWITVLSYFVYRYNRENPPTKNPAHNHRQVNQLTR